MQKIRNTIEEDIPFNFGGPTGCGDLLFDIRVYDREKESIESLIGRGLKDITGRYVGMLQARQLLNEYNGIGVYRNGFRIRPLGDADFDWLKLNEQRVQNPSMRIGSNQAIGYVQIQSEENSSLIEKSARDGLKENAAYKQLKSITKSVIAKLEEKRFEFRKKAGLSRPILKVEQEFEKLFSFDDLERNIRSKLSRSGINKKVTDEIIDIITREKNDKNKIVEEIRQAVAIYQGQATLGKIVNVILHEGRRPLNYFRNQIPNFHYWYDSFIKTNDYEKLEFIKPIADGIGQNAETFVKLFSRLDPLAAGKRSARKPIKLKNIIKDAVYIFEDNIKNQNVTVKVSGSDEFRFLAWQQDFYAIFTNLADNSIYWMNENKSSKREITVELATEGDSLLYIDYRDTGPGIEPNLIRSEVIYEPQFSTKPGGTGLGLAIAGEAASRNGLELRAFESETGAYFRLQPKSENS
jgi:C4-dicarboxylate-specific signal transduction histidine kinase